MVMDSGATSGAAFWTSPLAALSISATSLGLGVWDGFGWLQEGEVGRQVRDVENTSHGDVPGAVAWFGESGRAVCLYSNNTPKLIGDAWTKTTGWKDQGGVAGGVYCGLLAWERC
ncbi:MAG: hypothetical protein CSA24_00290 [Deltaproteobacteria bacterium]|nr:MAG: hypothetical protein CSB49_03915 [Pseudomonadota bacterium]PIE66390.1 MAG: hypothetical protein CSA24_00290 [Deltaproteobacteria bacterium]